MAPSYSAVPRYVSKRFMDLHSGNTRAMGSI
jgi:hypothetical protein